MLMQHTQLAHVIGTGRYIIDRFGQWPEQSFHPTVIKAGRATPHRRSDPALPLARTFKERRSIVSQIADLLPTYPRLQLHGNQGEDALGIAQHAVVEARTRAGVGSLFCSIREHDLIHLSEADTFQELCRQLFAIDGGGAFWFHLERLHADLAEVRSLIVLEGISGSAADTIARLLPNATLVYIGNADQQFRPITIPNLDLQETKGFVDGIIREQASPYKPPTAAQIAEIGRLLEFAPSPIELLIRLQRHRIGCDWDTLIGRLGEATSPDSLDRATEVCLRQLSTQQRQLLMILGEGKCSRAGLQAMHLDLNEDGSSHRLNEDLIALSEINLVQIANDDCEITSAALRRSFNHVAPPGEPVHAAIDRYVHTSIDQSTDNQALAWGQQHFAQIMGVYTRNRAGDARNTKRCLSVLVPLAAGSGWWDKWHDLAADALELARKTNDRPLEAWAQYELGVHAGLSGRIDNARTLLKQARKISTPLKSSPMLSLTNHAMHVFKLRSSFARSLLAFSAQYLAFVAILLLMLAAFLLFPPRRSILATTEQNVSVRIPELDRRSLLPEWDRLALLQLGGLWQIERIDGPAHGYLTRANDESYIYTPARDYAGQDTFSYIYTNRLGYTWAGTTSITVGGDSDFLSARVPDVAQVIVRRTAVSESIDVDGRDLVIEPEDDVLRFSDMQISGIGGNVSIIDSWLRFTPPPQITGTAVIELIVSSDHVAPVRRLLVIDVGGPAASQLPNAHDDADPTRPRYRVDLATPGQVMLNVLDNDIDQGGQPLSVRLPATTSLLGAQLNISADGREVLYEIGDRPRGAVPREDVDGFIYQACNPSGACAWALVSMLVGVPAYSQPLSTWAIPPASAIPAPTAVIVAPMAFFPVADSTNAQFMLIGSGFAQRESTAITVIDPTGHVFDTTAVANEAGIASVQLAARSNAPGIWVAALRGKTSGSLMLKTFQVADLAGAAGPLKPQPLPDAMEPSDK